MTGNSGFQPDVLNRLQKHPISPAPIAHLLSEGEAQRKRNRRRTTLFGTGAAVLAAAAAFTAVHALSPRDDETTVVSEPERSSEVVPALECSGQSISTDIDVIPPPANEPTKDLPSSAEEAARRTLNAPLLAAEQLGLGEYLPVNRSDGEPVVYFAATAADGSVQAILTVEELVEGVWGTTAIEHCAK